MESLHSRHRRASLSPAPFARGAMLARDGGKPVGARETVLIHGRLAGRCEPVRPLPTQFFAEHGALRLQRFIEGRSAQWSPTLMFLARPGDCVVLAVELE